MPSRGKQGTPLRKCATPSSSPMKDTATIDLKSEEEEEQKKNKKNRRRTEEEENKRKRRRRRTEQEKEEEERGAKSSKCPVRANRALHFVFVPHGVHAI